MSNTIGAGILNVITESLYEKPIVIFREYVQNSVDAFEKDRDSRVEIWVQGNNLYFLDNGKGIASDDFELKMRSIGASGKIRRDNIGYKGIGRLSGIAYCGKIKFVNICSRLESSYQEYQIDCNEYRKLKRDESYAKMDFDTLMGKIGKLSKKVSVQQKKEIDLVIQQREELFADIDTGFLVILNGITEVISEAISKKDFRNQLSWLLPVPFKKELLKQKRKDINFEQYISPQGEKGEIPAKSFMIRYNGDAPLERPIDEEKLRDYCATVQLSHAIGFVSFNLSRFAVASNNDFQGIRIYLNNMLLCDEREIAQVLIDYGLTEHTLSELVNTMRNIGSIIYIIDKENIYENARRTFIEILDRDSLLFIRELNSFVERIYGARYALSKYRSSLNKHNNQQNMVDELKEKAESALDALIDQTQTKEDWELKNEAQAFEDLSEVEKKQVIKQEINRRLGENLRKFISNANGIRPENAYDSFLDWIISNR